MDEPHAVLQVFLTRDYLAISMEFAQGGDLFAYTLGPKSFGKLAEVQARWIFQQLILGLDYCHRKVNPKLWLWTSAKQILNPKHWITATTRYFTALASCKNGDSHCS